MWFALTQKYLGTFWKSYKISQTQKNYLKIWKKKKTFLDHQKHKNFFRTILFGLLFLVLRFEFSVPGIFFKMRLLLLSIRLKASCAEFCFKIRLMLFAVSIWIKSWCWKLFWWDINKAFREKKQKHKKNSTKAFTTLRR